MVQWGEIERENWELCLGQLLKKLEPSQIFREVPKEREKQTWCSSKTHTSSFLVPRTTYVANVNFLLFLKKEGRNMFCLNRVTAHMQIAEVKTSAKRM